MTDIDIKGLQAEFERRVADINHLDVKLDNTLDCAEKAETRLKTLGSQAITTPGPESGFWWGVAVGALVVIPFWMFVIWWFWG
jgi:hypothetical protein